MIKFKSLLFAGCVGLVVTISCPVVAAELPVLDHVLLIMLENHSYQDIIGNTDAPYINQLAHRANLATNYYAIGHPSLTNYLEVVGGSNFGIQNDDYPDWHGATPSDKLNEPLSGDGADAATPAVMAPQQRAVPSAQYHAESIADQLIAQGESWKTYQQSVPVSGHVDGVDYSDGIYSNLNNAPGVSIAKLYAAKHNPFVYFASVQRNGLNNVVGFDGVHGLFADLATGTLPTFAYIVPNQCHDMHGMDNGGTLCGNPAALVQMGDATVRQLVEAIHTSPAWQQGNNAIIVMWDENSVISRPNQVVVIVDTNHGVHGVVSQRPYNHFSLLKTLENGFGLTCLNHACDTHVQVMTDMFAASPVQHTEK